MSETGRTQQQEDARRALDWLDRHLTTPPERAEILIEDDVERQRELIRDLLAYERRRNKRLAAGEARRDARDDLEPDPQ